MTYPILRADALDPGLVDEALGQWGGFALETRAAEADGQAALAAAHELFALPRDVKAALAIEGSRHFRGWSEMHNERDWREQLHLGRERPAAVETPAFWRLQGPNLWPPSRAWRATVTRYMEDVAALGQVVLGAIAAALELPGAPFAGVDTDGYLVMKLIAYHPQPAGAVARPGVAPHVDFSWLTMTLQDSAGLEVRARDGVWTLIEPRPGRLWVHAGELLQFATRGRYPAAPHRVVNPSLDRTRVSIPFFVNPPLPSQVVPLVASATPPDPGASDEHVHRVLRPDGPALPLHFGASEWRRKGLNGWCAACSPPRESANGT